MPQKYLTQPPGLRSVPRNLTGGASTSTPRRLVTVRCCGWCGSGLTITVLLILAVLWAAVLVPPALRSRSENRRGETIGPLNYRLGSGGGRSLGSALSRGPASFRPAAFPSRNGPSRNGGPVPVRAGGEMTPAQKRRRDVLIGLLGAAGLTFVLAVFTGMIAVWLLHLLADALLGGYVYLLVQLKQRGTVPGAAAPLPPPIPLERPRQARHVAHLQPTRELALRRSAGY